MGEGYKFIRQGPDTDPALRQEAKPEQRPLATQPRADERVTQALGQSAVSRTVERPGADERVTQALGQSAVSRTVERPEHSRGPQRSTDRSGR